MTLEKPLLEKPSDVRHQMLEAYPERGYAATVTADRSDSIGCLVWDIFVKRTADFADGTALRTWAERIAKRASGLLESLKVLEIDDSQNIAILRSDTPSRRDGVIAYYEVRVTGTSSANVRRYQIDSTKGRPREQVAFAVTNESLEKLVRDIAE